MRGFGWAAVSFVLGTVATTSIPAVFAGDDSGPLLQRRIDVLEKKVAALESAITVSGGSVTVRGTTVTVKAAGELRLKGAVISQN